MLVFWGDAQWSRVQMLGELARGHWGLCRASVADIIAPPAERRAGLDGRLIYAPKTVETCVVSGHLAKPPFCVESRAGSGALWLPPRVGSRPGGWSDPVCPKSHALAPTRACLPSANVFFCRHVFCRPLRR